MTLIAIGVEIFAMKEMQGTSRALRFALTFGTVISSWAFVHVVFAIYYAHEYPFRECKGHKKKLTAAGLQFPGENHAGLLGFLYFAFTIGMTAQTSDVVIRSRRMRRLVIVHGIVVVRVHDGGDRAHGQSRRPARRLIIRRRPVARREKRRAT